MTESMLPILGEGPLTLADFGAAVLCAVLLGASYTFAVALRAAAGRPHLLVAARLGAYATSCLVLLGVLLLSYAFVAHDFSIRYVARYSDRSTHWVYLLTALWGGQDGSLLWWLLLTSANVTVAVNWLKGRYRPLQPYVIATLMVVIAFFALLMIFAANPFQTFLDGARRDGEGLNALLRNPWMIIHPPALYAGFVGCTVPFAFAVAALVTGRLDSEWILAIRKWMLSAWLLLTLGNVLGMVWAYEELGWGGMWNWDPVENAAFLPWLTASAYVHSTMIQERRAMLKVWNVVLIAGTFFLTILGTFMTRSGMIASVHSFAQSSIGEYFVWFMGLIVVTTIALIAWRWPLLRAQTRIESLLSRESAFVLNNWALVALMLFVLVSTLVPLFAETLLGEKLLLGAPHYNLWVPPLALLVFLLMGLAPLFGWRKTSPDSLRAAFRWPLAGLVAGALLHVLLGPVIGLPAIVLEDAPFAGPLGVVMQYSSAAYPLVTIALAVFNTVVIGQEFVRGVRARRSAAEQRSKPEALPVALLRLVDRNRRRYGGYIVHLGVIAAFVGLAGSAWSVHREVTLLPGETATLTGYTFRYDGSRTCPGSPACTPAQHADREKRMVYATLAVSRRGHYLGIIEPAQFVYARESTTEIGLWRGFREDLYVSLLALDSTSQRATLGLFVNPLVGWVWIGAAIMVLGATVSLWSELEVRRLGAWGFVRAVTTAMTAALLGLILALAPSPARTTEPAPAAAIGP
ncbi:MAG: heme lyase CcmF/NrfE family subunit [Polyangiaceae bacterium]|nr:heme lyase CcmF/NrfE family subunit [Polyangiaceae bacterium]